MRCKKGGVHIYNTGGILHRTGCNYGIKTTIEKEAYPYRKIALPKIRQVFCIGKPIIFTKNTCSSKNTKGDF